MILIRDIVKQTLMAGYLSRKNEEQLRYLLQCTRWGVGEWGNGGMGECGHLAR